jgi:hypothetical protein
MRAGARFGNVFLPELLSDFGRLCHSSGGRLRAILTERLVGGRAW